MVTPRAETACAPCEFLMIFLLQLSSLKMDFFVCLFLISQEAVFLLSFCSWVGVFVSILFGFF